MQMDCFYTSAKSRGSGDARSRKMGVHTKIVSIRLEGNNHDEIYYKEK